MRGIISIVILSILGCKVGFSQTQQIVITSQQGTPISVSEVKECSDGGILASINLANFTPGLTKLNSSGAVLWCKTIVITPSMIQGNYSFACGELSNGNYYMLYSSTDGLNSEITNVSYSSTGILISAKKYAYSVGAAGYYRNSAYQAVNGDISISISNRSSVDLLRVDQNGSLLGGKRFVSPNSLGKSPSFASTITSDGGLITTAKDDNSQYLVKTDASGALQWDRSYNDGDYKQAYSIIESVSGDYFVAGMGNAYGYIMKLDAIGNVLWQKEYSDLLVRSMQQMNNGNILAMCVEWSGDIRVVIFDQDGIPLSEENMNYLDPMGASLLNETSNYFYYMGSISPSEAIVFKFDKNANDLCSTVSIPSAGPNLITPSYILTNGAAESSIGVESNVALTDVTNLLISADFCGYVSPVEELAQPETAFNLYPNPAVGNATIELRGGVPNETIVTITDIKGATQCTIYGNGQNQINLPVSDMASGMYFVVVQANGELLGRKKLVVK